MLNDAERSIAIGMCWQEFHELEDSLEAWMEARPFMFRGACPYARSLIISMIALCEQMMVHGDEEAKEERENLLLLLDELPPPTTGPLFAGQFLYVRSVKGLYATSHKCPSGSEKYPE